MRWRYLSVSPFGLLPLLLFAVACLRTAEIPREADKKPAAHLVNASFYGEQHAGQRAASGEVFNPDALTAAHRSYPFGTILKVTNPKNGKSVRVRVNDRGPYAHDRSLDLSRRAAREIGIERSGVGAVRIEVIKLGGEQNR